MTETGAVIVSGGTYGIGRRIVLELATRGFPVVAFGLDARQPGSLAEKGMQGTRAALTSLNLEADLLEADVAVAEDVARVVGLALEKHHRIAGLVNNAAIRPTGTVLDTEEALFERVVDVNLNGAYRMCRATLPHLRDGGGGVIVNLGSRAAVGRAGLAAYAASKGGLHALTQAMAQDHQRDGVRIHLVVPAPGTASGMIEAMEAAGEKRRPRAADDAAVAVADLFSPKSKAKTGSIVEVGP
jgi:NAD(P)-dependent dehydrogenase (short-subunit alcohol dehydrogenase family)